MDPSFSYTKTVVGHNDYGGSTGVPPSVVLGVISRGESTSYRVGTPLRARTETVTLYSQDLSSKFLVVDEERVELLPLSLWTQWTQEPSTSTRLGHHAPSVRKWTIGDSKKFSKSVGAGHF